LELTADAAPGFWVGQVSAADGRAPARSWWLQGLEGGATIAAAEAVHKNDDQVGSAASGFGAEGILQQSGSHHTDRKLAGPARPGGNDTENHCSANDQQIERAANSIGRTGARSPGPARIMERLPAPAALASGGLP